MNFRNSAGNARKDTNARSYEVVKKRFFSGVMICTLSLHLNQAQSSQSEAEAVAALCDAMRYQAYNTMELRQLSVPKYKLKDMVDRNITNVNSRMKQYKLITEAYAVVLSSPERADAVALEFAETQRAKCMRDQNM